MYRCLNPWNIGIQIDWEKCVPLAREAGFEGIDVPIGADPTRRGQRRCSASTD